MWKVRFEEGAIGSFAVARVLPAGNPHSTLTFKLPFAFRIIDAFKFDLVVDIDSISIIYHHQSTVSR